MHDYPHRVEIFLNLKKKMRRMEEIILTRIIGNEYNFYRAEEVNGRTCADELGAFGYFLVSK